MRIWRDGLPRPLSWPQRTQKKRDLQTNCKPAPPETDQAEGTKFDFSGMIGAPRRIRTPDPQIRSLVATLSNKFQQVPFYPIKCTLSVGCHSCTLTTFPLHSGYLLT